jgi:carbon-monoxide dehydrogenase large subunit
MALGTRAVPTKTNPLGVKGGAETGTIGLPPAVVGAVADALRPLGVTDLAMPLTPNRLWAAIRAAKETA